MQEAGFMLSIASAMSLPSSNAAQASDFPQDEGRRDAWRFLRRSGFDSGFIGEANFERSTLPRLIDTVVDAASRRKAAQTEPPAWASEPIALSGSMTVDERRKLVERLRPRVRELQVWWMQEMLTTPTPLTERMTLFWSNRFTSSYQVVPWMQLMYKQNVMLRRNALGNYRTLLHEMVRDPAMVAYLNGQQNRKQAPNENFARELLELFTLGEGHYTEADIKQAARAFTGWKVISPGVAEVDSRQFDEGRKSFFGKSGHFDGHDIIDIILEQPRAAEFVVENLWREFVSPAPDTRVVARLANDFRRDWEVAPLLKALFKQPIFIEQARSGSLVKSPVELVVGLSRELRLPIPPNQLVYSVDRMGQRLFAPPNVKGWPSGEDWITTNWLLERRNFVLMITGDVPTPGKTEAAAVGGEMMAMAEPPERHKRPQMLKLQRQFGAIAEELLPRGPELQLLALAPVQPPIEGAKPPDRLQAWLLDPVYQLK
jgi:uncharacterized protein (DUF1800 family)